MRPYRWQMALAVMVVATAAGTAKAPVEGYGVRIDAVAVSGPPPAAGSAAAAADKAALARSAAGIGSPAWQQAQQQIGLRSRTAVRIMSCALGRVVSAEATPATARLLARTYADMAGPINEAKKSFRRDRPFVGDANQQTCDARTRDTVKAGSGDVLGFSYPSGHAAQGTLAALVLAQVAPARASALQAWGKAVGDNRIVCRVHWPSDVAAGRRLGAAVFDALKGKPAFAADVAAARRELESAPLAIAC